VVILLKFKEIIEKVKSAYRWTVAKVRAAYAYVVERRPVIEAAAAQVVTKVREVALTVHRGLVNAFYRGQLAAYTMDDACLCGGAGVVQAFRHSLTVVRRMTNAEVAHAIHVIRQGLKVECVLQADPVALAA